MLTSTDDDTDHRITQRDRGLLDHVILEFLDRQAGGHGVADHLQADASIRTDGNALVLFRVIRKLHIDQVARGEPISARVDQGFARQGSPGRVRRAAAVFCGTIMPPPALVLPPQALPTSPSGAEHQGPGPGRCPSSGDVRDRDALLIAPPISQKGPICSGRRGPAISFRAEARISSRLDGRDRRHRKVEPGLPPQEIEKDLDATGRRTRPIDDRQ